FGAEPRFLAVETSKIFPGEVQDLWPKLINSETTASFFSHGLKGNTYSNLQLLGVMIFDTRTGRFVSNQGYISVDTTPRDISAGDNRRIGYARRGKGPYHDRANCSYYGNRWINFGMNPPHDFDRSTNHSTRTARVCQWK